MESLNTQENLSEWIKETIIISLINEFNLKEHINTFKEKEFNKSIKIDNKFEINFISSKMQHGGALCGYHTLFNILNYLKYRTKGYDEYYLKKMNSNVNFWKTYSKLTKELCLIFLDDIEHITEGGSLDRLHLNFLTANNPKFLSLINNQNFEIKFTGLFFAFGCFSGMGGRDIISLQNSLDYIKNYNSTKPLIHVITLGIANHWSSLIIEKEAGKIKLVYLDSGNENVFNLKDWAEEEYDICTEFTDSCTINHSTQKEYVDYTEQACIEIARYRKPLCEWLKKCYIQWVHDINFIVRLVYKTVFESFSLYELYLDSYIRRLITVFKVKVCWDGGDVENRSDLLVKYLNEDYHPKILYEDIFTNIKIFGYQEKIKTMKIYPEFLKWLEISNKMKMGLDLKQTNNNNDILGRYFIVVDEIKTLLGLN
jgi:hypothetical protein